MDSKPTSNNTLAGCAASFVTTAAPDRTNNEE